jgi:hypothetical protein
MKYPIFTFNGELFNIRFGDEDAFTCSRKAFIEGYYCNLKIVDADSMLYELESVAKLYRVKSIWDSLSLNPRYRVRPILKNQPNKIQLSQIKEMIFLSFEEWEGWQSRGDFDELKRRVEMANGIEELFQIMDWRSDARSK